MVSTACWSLKVMSLKTAPAGNVDLKCTFQEHGRSEDPWLSRFSSLVTYSQWPPLTFYSHGGLLPSYKLPPPLYCAPRGQQGAWSFTRVEVACSVAIWLHWRQIPRQWYGHMQNKTQINMLISKTSNIHTYIYIFFSHEEPRDPNHWFIKTSRLGVMYSGH